MRVCFLLERGFVQCNNNWFNGCYQPAVGIMLRRCYLCQREREIERERERETDRKERQLSSAREIVHPCRIYAAVLLWIQILDVRSLLSVRSIILQSNLPFRDLMPSEAKLNQAPISQTNLCQITDFNTPICSKLSPLFSVVFTTKLSLLRLLIWDCLYPVLSLLFVSDIIT